MKVAGKGGRVTKDWVARAQRFLDEEEADSGIIVGRGAEVTYWHLTFQEFLAAKARRSSAELRAEAAAAWAVAPPLRAGAEGGASEASVCGGGAGGGSPRARSFGIRRRPMFGAGLPTSPEPPTAGLPHASGLDAGVRLTGFNLGRRQA